MKHLTLSDRIRIETLLEERKSFSQIAAEIGKCPTTISREVRRHRSVVHHYSSETARKRSECEHFGSCTVKGLCGRPQCETYCSKCRSKRCSLFCKNYAPKICALLKKPPYVCNKCQKLRSCSHDFFFYRAKYADDAYLEIKASSRRSINQIPESLEQLDKLISPLLKQGQPLSHIYLSHKEEIGCSQRTLYNYIDQNLFTVINLDLPRKVRYKPRKKRHGDREIPGYRKGRTYADFELYMTQHPDSPVVEMDVVEGAGGKGGKVFLTLLFRNCLLMLIFLLPADRRESIKEVFHFLYDKLGAKSYGRLFPVILTDNDSAFKDPKIFERENENGEDTHVYYCDPMASWQKGRLEKNHEFIRYILPKGSHFSNLTQEDATRMANHINSTARASLNGHTPFELAHLLLDKKLIELCRLTSIPANQVVLKPSLLK